MDVCPSRPKSISKSDSLSVHQSKNYYFCHFFPEKHLKYALNAQNTLYIPDMSKYNYLERTCRNTHTLTHTHRRQPCDLSDAIREATSQRLVLSIWQKPSPFITASLLLVDLSLLLVLIQGQRTWSETGLAVLKKPKCQTMTCCQLPASLICCGSMMLI